MSARTHVPRHPCFLLVFTSMKPNSLVLVLFQVELVSCVNAAAARRAACNLLAFNFPPPINFPPAPRPPRSKSSLSYMMIGRNETCLEKRTLFLLGSPRLKRRPNFTETASSSSSIYSNLCFAVVLALVLGDMCNLYIINQLCLFWLFIDPHQGLGSGSKVFQKFLKSCFQNSFEV